MKNFDIFSIGKLNNVNDKTFIKDKINATSLEMSFQNIPANTKNNKLKNNLLYTICFLLNLTNALNVSLVIINYLVFI